MPAAPTGRRDDVLKIAEIVHKADLADDRYDAPQGPRLDIVLRGLSMDGNAWHPQRISDRFDRLVATSGLPPVRLHDLRHCAATFLKAAGADMKDIQETLGHSSITITGDTYTSVVHELDTERAKADAAAALVPRTSRRDHENPPPAALISKP
jgi:integrase